MGVALEAGLEVGNSLARVGSSIGLGIAIARAEHRIRREQAVDSVSELALRLQEARQAQRGALRRAGQAEARLGAAQAEIAALRQALVQERHLTTALREALGI